MTALPASGSFTMVDPTHVAEVGAAAALLYARIVWRSEQGPGSWRATRRQIRDETGLSEAVLRAAVAVLRDHEWIETERTSAEDATLIWRPLPPCDQQKDDLTPPRAESSPPPARTTPTPPAESAISSLETGKDLLGGEVTVLRPVPDDQPTKPARAAKKGTRLPGDYAPKDAHWTLAASLGVDLRHEGPQFVDHHTAKGSVMKDWDAALRTWIRNAAKFAEQRRGPTVVVPATGEAYDKAYAAALPPPRLDPFAPRIAQ